MTLMASQMTRVPTTYLLGLIMTLGAGTCCPVALGSEASPSGDLANPEIASIQQTVDQLDLAVASQDAPRLAWALSRAYPLTAAPVQAALLRAIRYSLTLTITAQRHCLMDVALDDLIRGHADTLTGKDLVTLSSDRWYLPAVCLLVSAHPDDHGPFLRTLFSRPTDDATWAAVGGLLAAMRAPGFAADLLRDLHLELVIDVRDDYGGGGSVSGSSTSGDGRVEVPPGFPTVPSYHLSFEPHAGDVVVTGGLCPVFAVRHEFHPGSNGVGSHHHPIDRDQLRLGYADWMLGVSDPATAHAAHSHAHLQWATPDAYLAAAHATVASYQRSIEDLRSALATAKLLTATELAQPMNPISVAVTDSRTDRHQKLPDLEPVAPIGPASQTAAKPRVDY